MRLEQIRQDHNECGKNMIRNLKLKELKRQYPFEDQNSYPKQHINHFLKDIPFIRSEIVSVLKNSPFMQKILDKAMAKAQITKMHKKDMASLYGRKYLEFFGGKS